MDREKQREAQRKSRAKHRKTRNEKARIYRKNRYANDPEFRQRVRDANNKRYQDPEWAARIRESRRQKYATDPEYRQKVKDSNRARFLKEGWRQDEYNLKKYGITRDDYLRMFHEQKGLCKICGEIRNKLAVDHCHSTGKVRALLCRNCNSSLGMMNDRADLLEKAAAYLRSYAENPENQKEMF